METEDRIKAIEAELQQTKSDLKDILFDIRKYLAGMPSPVPDDKPAKPRVKGGKTK